MPEKTKGRSRAIPTATAPDPTITTPGTRCSWRGVRAWLEASHALEARRCSSTKYQQQGAHLHALAKRGDVIESETDADALREALRHVKTARQYREPKGMRAGTDRTHLIDLLHNRIQRLDRDARQPAVRPPLDRHGRPIRAVQLALPFVFLNPEREAA